MIWPPLACLVGACLSGWGLPGGSDCKESACNAGDPGSIPGLEGSPGEGNGNPLQHSCLENPLDRGNCRPTVQGVAEELTTTSQLNNNVRLRKCGDFLKRVKKWDEHKHFLLKMRTDERQPVEQGSFPPADVQKLFLLPSPILSSVPFPWTSRGERLKVTLTYHDIPMFIAVRGRTSSKQWSGSSSCILGS